MEYQDQRSENPLVSVIIPAYNCELYINKCLDSILNQTYQNIEIVIADDGSTDRTKSIIDSYKDKRIRRFHNEANIGNLKTRNKLFQFAAGDFLTAQDADDWASPDRISEQVRLLQRHYPKIRAAGTAFVRVSRKGIISDLKRTHPGTIYELSIQDEALGFAPVTVMIHRTIYEAVGGLHPYFNRLAGEDNYWVRRILLHTNCLVINKPLYYYQENPESITQKAINPRILVMPKVLELLRSQMEKTGSDWLAEGKLKQVYAFEKQLLQGSYKKELSRKYRQRAAIAFDRDRHRYGWNCLSKAFAYHPLNGLIYRTVLYGIRKHWNRSNNN